MRLGTSLAINQPRFFGGMPTPPDDQIKQYILDGSNPNVVRVGGADYRQAPSGDGIGSWYDSSQSASADVDAPDINGIQAACSFSMWVHTKQFSSNRNFIEHGSTAAGGTGFLIGLTNNGTVRLRTDATNYTSTEVISIGDWKHLVVTIDGSTVTFYFDGAFSNEILGATINTFSGSDLVLGDSTFEGGLNDIRIYDRVLGPEEISAFPLARVDWNPSVTTTTVYLNGARIASISDTAGAVSQWDDLSGNNYHAVQPSGSFQPTTETRELNGLNALDFQLDAMDLPSALYNVPEDSNFFAVCQADVDTTRLDTYCGRIGTSTRYGMFSNVFNNDEAQFAQRTGAAFATINPGDTLNPHIWSYNCASGDGDAYRDAVLEASEITSALTLGDLTIGARGSPGSYSAGRYQGRICELIRKDSDMPTSERQQFEGHLAWKWFITEGAA